MLIDHIGSYHFVLKVHTLLAHHCLSTNSVYTFHHRNIKLISKATIQVRSVYLWFGQHDPLNLTYA